MSIGSWKRLGKHWKTRRIILNTVQNAEKTAFRRVAENTAISHFEVKIAEIPQEKLFNTAIPQTPMFPCAYIRKCQTNKALTRIKGLESNWVFMSSFLLQTRDVSCAAAHFHCEFTCKRPFALFWVIFGAYYILMVWYNILKKLQKNAFPSTSVASSEITELTQWRRRPEDNA